MPHSKHTSSVLPKAVPEVAVFAWCCPGGLDVRTLYPTVQRPGRNSILPAHLSSPSMLAKCNVHLL